VSIFFRACFVFFYPLLHTMEDDTNDFARLHTVDTFVVSSETQHHAQRINCGAFWAVTFTDIQDLVCLALPIVLTSIAMMGMELITVAAAAHLGVLELDAAGLARIIANCTGVAPIIGLAMALDTLATQAYGAANYLLVGDIAQRAVVITACVCTPIVVLWCYATPVLVLLGQDPEVIPLAQTYLRWYSLGIIPRAVVEVMCKFLQVQGIVYPNLAIMVVVLAIHGALTYTLIWPMGLGFDGVPLALCLSYVIHITLMLLYVRLSGTWLKTWAKTDPRECWAGWSRRLFQDWGPFLKLGVPGALLVCLDWWAFEIVMLEAGVLGISSMAAAGIVMQLTFMVYMVPLGLSMATAVLVGQGLGAGRPKEARHTARSAVLAAGVWGAVIAVSVFFGLPVFARGFTDDVAVVEHIGTLRPLSGVLCMFDALSVVIAGILRGTGMQAWGAGFTFLGQWGVGLPIGASAAFLYGFGVRGLYAGLLCGVAVVPLLDGLIACRINWSKMSTAAKKRSGSLAPDDMEFPMIPTEY